MKKFKEITSSLLNFVTIMAVGFGSGYWYCSTKNEGNSEIVDNSTTDLKLPGEKEKRTVTIDEVETKLVEIGELSTYSGQYTVTKENDYSRYFLDDIKVPGTKNTVHLECEGIVKVGYNVNDIGINIDNTSRTICLSLPEASVTSNYVIWDTVQYKEQNNPLHPIAFEQYQKLIDEIEDEGLSQAEEKGIYREAEKHLQKIIVNFLSGMDGYTVKFI